ncbi:NAD(P)-dependent alcohol dehydrogenase [Sunxiuqinia sp. A32]|uniref:NAD(P)-dependent alcohol dehydrogenase n=1 Tax=Sunxiuqinia sp. A32 TaxID=3461496 RepID=UPI0040452FBD
MKAIVCTKYGAPDVLQMQEMNNPVPKEDEILIKVKATTVTAGDVRIRAFRVPLLFWFPFRLLLGLRRPKKSILGVEFAGEIEFTGQKITKYKTGDRVYGSTPWLSFGCYAEYLIMKEDGIIAEIPKNLSYEEVASVPFMGIGALYFVRKANIQKGQKMLIYGASGAVGTYAVQLANYFGAEVTAVCSTQNVDLVKSLGAELVVDYKKDDLSRMSSYSMAN